MENQTTPTETLTSPQSGSSEEPTKAGSMSEARAARFALAFAHLCEIHGREMTDRLLEAYAEATSDIEAGLLMYAMKQATTTLKFFPKPVELRQLAGERTPEERAARAFEYVQTAIRSVGIYSSPDFDDPTTNATLYTLGGWVRLCELDREERDKWYRKDFIATYTSKMRTGLAPDEGGYLLGICAQENGRDGYDFSENKIIGGPRSVQTDLPQLPGVVKPDVAKIATNADGKPLLEFKRP